VPAATRLPGLQCWSAGDAPAIYRDDEVPSDQWCTSGPKRFIPSGSLRMKLG